ncbi:MAG: hypothetical protein ACYTGH_20165 [Planctomycetota bacterium]
MEIDTLTAPFLEKEKASIKKLGRGFIWSFHDGRRGHIGTAMTRGEASRAIDERRKLSAQENAPAAP